MTHSIKEKRIVSIVARKDAIALAPYLEEEIGAESITANTRHIYIWLMNQTEAEVNKLKDTGIYVENESTSIKYQAALNDVPPYLAARESKEKVTLDTALALAKQFYVMSDALETIDTHPQADDKAFEDAARIKAEENGMPYPDEMDKTPATDPIKAADMYDDPDPNNEGYEGYEGYEHEVEKNNISNERNALIDRILTAGKVLGQETRAAVDQVIAKAETTYPGKTSLNQLSIEELHKLIDFMDNAILSLDTAKS